MNTIKKTALISTLYTQGHGGVYTMLGLVVDMLKQLGFDIKIAYYMPYKIQPNLSVPAAKIFHQRPKATSFVGDFGVEEYAIGAILPELEFTHYYPHAVWKKLINASDYHFVVSGPVLAALPFYLTNKKYLAWIASPYNGDRKDRVKLFPWYRKCLDYLIVSKISGWLEKKLLKSGTVLTISTYSKHEFQADQKWIRDVMPMPIDTRQFLPDENRVKPWLICFTARFLDPRKNIYFLLSAFSYVLESNKNARLLLIGDEVSGALQEKLRELKIESHVDIFNHLTRPEIISHLQAADVFAIPSHQEGLCISGLEAMACGCPVVSTQCGGPSDYIVNDQNGCLTDFDIEQFSQSIIRICTDRELRNKLSLGAVKTIQENYSFEKTKTIFNNYMERTFL